jgi:hypothetical protein
VVVGSVHTGTVGVSHTIIRPGCEDADRLNALVVHAGTGIERVTCTSIA